MTVIYALVAEEPQSRSKPRPFGGPGDLAADRASHLDTPLVLACLPSGPVAKVVTAAADYFFDPPWKAEMWSPPSTVPMERAKLNRDRDRAESLLPGAGSGHLPRGRPQPGRMGPGVPRRRRLARHPQGRGGAGPPLQAAEQVFPKGASELQQGKVEVRFGDPLWPGEVRAPSGKEEDARRFAARIEESVALLADEAETDWWSARRRAAAGETPDFRGPDASPWRRAWALPASARRTRSPRARSSAKPW